MFRGRSSIMICQPVEVVFAMLPAIGTAPGATYSFVQQIPEGSIGIGTVFVFKASGLTTLSEVTEYEPYRKLALQLQISGWLHGTATGSYSF